MPAPIPAATAGKAVLAFLARAWPFILGIVLLVAGLAGIVRLLDARAAKDKAAATIATAAPKAAQEAHAELDRVIEREHTIEREVRDNVRIIREAPGADAPLAAAVTGAGRRALCLRAPHRDDPACAKLLGDGAPDADAASGRRPDPHG